MSQETIQESATDNAAAHSGIGSQLRAAREAKGLSVEQLAAETRISRRHIENIEEGRFAELPGRTYAVGFSRTLAKLIDLDQDDVVAMVRAELDAEGPQERRSIAAETFQPGDPARAPGGRLALFSLFAVVLLLVGIFFSARVLFSPAAELPSLLSDTEDGAEIAADGNNSEGAEAVAVADANGAVVLTAEGEVWVRFADAQSRVLTEQILQEGDRYTVPADAASPTITTARPDLLAITIGGQQVPKLSDVMVTLEAEPVSAGALLARSTQSSEQPATN